MKIKISLASVIAVGAVASMFSVTALAQFDLVDSESLDITFEHKDVFLSGTLLLPEGEKPFPVVLFIHGDGAQDRFAGDSYSLVLNSFLEKGIACFTWDKKGVGESGGNWLHQSMSGRADEALVALQTLKKRDDIDPERIGYIGFSQAGWVIPEIAGESDEPAFYIMVGGAINWLEQSEYITRTRMVSEGFSENDVQQVLSYSALVNELILSTDSYDDYVLFHKNNPSPKGYLANLMSEDRLHFVRLNMNSDITESIKNINKPLLAIWGSDDLNVDAAKSYSTYREARNEMTSGDVTLLMHQGATHSMLHSKTYNYHLVDQWPLFTLLRYLLEGKDAYSEGYLDVLGEWTHEKLHQE